MQLIKETIKGQVRKIIKAQGFCSLNESLAMTQCQHSLHTLHEYQTNHQQGWTKSLVQIFYLNKTILERNILYRTLNLSILFPLSSESSTLLGVCPG